MTNLTGKLKIRSSRAGLPECRRVYTRCPVSLRPLSRILGSRGASESSTQLAQSQAGPRGVLLAVGSTFASSLFVGPLLLFYFAL